MNGNKTLEELTIRDNFMFSAVMATDSENCRLILERTLDMPIDRVKVVTEKTMVYHPEFKGIRLDVYAKEQTAKGVVDRHFDVEMQVANKKIFKRSRYYHSQMDMEILNTGLSYEELPDTYVIFICDFDPVGLGKYKYTLRFTFAEDNTYEYNDGTHTVFLNTKGTNQNEVPASLVSFLKYVGSELEDSELDYDDPLVKRLQKTVSQVKSDREMGVKYMLFEEMLKDEFKAGKIEAIKDLLADVGTITQTLDDKLVMISDKDIIRTLLKKAAKVSSIEEFEEELNKLTASE